MAGVSPEAIIVFSSSGQSNRFKTSALIIMQKTKSHNTTKTQAITVPTISIASDSSVLPIASVAVT